MRREITSQKFNADCELILHLKILYSRKNVYFQQSSHHFKYSKAIEEKFLSRYFLGYDFFLILSENTT